MSWRAACGGVINGLFSLDTAGSLVELGKGKLCALGAGLYGPDARCSRMLWVPQTPVHASEPWAPCPAAHLSHGHPICLCGVELRPEKRDAETGILDLASLYPPCSVVRDRGYSPFHPPRPHLHPPCRWIPPNTQGLNLGPLHCRQVLYHLDVPEYIYVMHMHVCIWMSVACTHVYVYIQHVHVCMNATACGYV